jgi:salicylate hydroxylase
VIIVGGGIGGLSLALALARRGVDSTVLEQAPAIEAVGAGIQLSPNATRVLIGWGLEAELVTASVEPDRAEVRDAATGRLLLTNRLGAYARQRWGAPYLTIARSALQALLAAAVQGSGRAQLRLGMPVAVVDADAGAVETETGERLAGHAVVGCDGLRSAVQAALFGAAPPRFTGQTAWRGMARVEDAEPVVQVFTGPRRHFVRYPLGGGLVNMVAVKEASAGEVEAWDDEGSSGELASAFADWPDPVRTTIAAVEGPWRQALYARAPLPRWSRGCATLLGDAAHPMLPFLAQGGSMAIEDAEALAVRLTSGADVPAACLDYQRARLPRTAKVQAWAARNARLFHLPSPVARAAFAAAAASDRLLGRAAEARLDWLYGFGG